MSVNEHLEARRRGRAVRGTGTLPHGRRCRLHRLRRVVGPHGRGHHRRGGRHQAHRARRHPGRRPDLRQRHGRPQAGGLLLMTELLRLATAGSVDDGKSTLIGRLLYDSKAIYEDQLDAIRRTSLRRGNAETDLSLLTDGLRAEREQGITIDVAYRYFSTPKRKFIIADTPGHAEYTRNMVTGASNAHLAMILIDARNGIVEQSRRHAFLSHLLGIPHMVVCVNKMDLVDWDRDRFEEIKDEFMTFATRLDVRDVAFIPMSALHGDNVVNAVGQRLVVPGRAPSQPPRNGVHRERRELHRPTVPGAVRHQVTRFDERRLPWLRRDRGQRGLPPRRPGGGHALRGGHHHSDHRDGGRPRRGGLPSHGRRHDPRRPGRCGAGRHDLPPEQPAQHDAGDRGHGELDGRPAHARRRHAASAQAHHQGGPGHRRGRALQDGHQRPAPGRVRDRARPSTTSVVFGCTRPSRWRSTTTSSTGQRGASS